MRILATTLALLSMAALCGCPVDGSTNGGGDLECDSGLNTRVGCPTDPNVHTLTAVEALQGMKDAFEVQFPGVVWMGGIAGIYIDRGGKAMDKGVSTTVGGYTMETASGWTGNFCVDQPSAVADDSLNFDTSNGSCTAVRSCVAINCNAVPAFTFPTIDTPAAIQAAFPDDGADSLYYVQLALLADEYWTITRTVPATTPAVTRRVHVTTGAVQ